MPDSRPGLERFTGYLLRRAYVEVVGLTEQLMPDGVHVRQAVLVALLQERGPLSGHEIAELVRINRTLVVKLVDAVEAHGWAVRGRHPRDRRSYALSLTAAGVAAHPGLQDALDEVEERFLRDLTTEERERLHELLVLVLDDPLVDDPVLGVATLAGRSSFLVVRAHRALRERAATAMTTIGLHPRDFGALSVLADGQHCSQAELAARMGVSPPGVVGLVEELVQKGLVDRARGVADRRVRELSLTESGGRTLASAHAVASRIQVGLAERLGVRGDEELRALLSRLAPDAEKSPG